MTDFKVGDRVMCVDPGYGNGLERGKIYTVTEYIRNSGSDLIEVDNAHKA